MFNYTIGYLKIHFPLFIFSVIIAAAQLFGGLNPELYREERDSNEFDFPEGHLGRIWFGLDYDAPTERLLVKVNEKTFMTILNLKT